MNHDRDSYILFIDESGKSKLSDETGRYFLLSGVIIDKNLHEALSNYIVSLKSKCGIPVNQNIHAFDLFENEKLKGGPLIKVAAIDLLFERLISLSHGVEMHAVVLQIDKQAYRQKIERTAIKHKVNFRRVYNELKKNNLHDLLYEVAVRKMVLEFGYFLEGHNAVGEVIAESRRQDDEATLRAFVDSTNSSRFPVGSTYRAWSQYSFDHIHSLTFQNKKGLSFGLEIADLLAWGTFNKVWGIARNYPSKQKFHRINKRINTVVTLKKELLLKKNLEVLTTSKINTVAYDRVSELSKVLENIDFS
jgi:Protein of unknown function (DUF3800)